MKYVIAGAIVAALLYGFGICMCIAARRADEQAEKIARERHRLLIERNVQRRDN